MKPIWSLVTCMSFLHYGLVQFGVVYDTDPPRNICHGLKLCLKLCQAIRESVVHSFHL